MLDVDNNHHLRAKAYVENLKGDDFRFHIDTWNDTVFRAAINWFFPGDCAYQLGKFDAWEDHPASKLQQTTTKKITFSRPYPSSPQAVIWLNSVDTGNETNTRVKAFATDIAADGINYSH